MSVCACAYEEQQDKEKRLEVEERGLYSKSTFRSCFSLAIETGSTIS